MIETKAVAKMAADYAAAWNSKSAKAVASFYAEDGEIIITMATRGVVGRAFRKWLQVSTQMSQI